MEDQVSDILGCIVIYIVQSERRLVGLWARELRGPAAMGWGLLQGFLLCRRKTVLLEHMEG